MTTALDPPEFAATRAPLHRWRIRLTGLPAVSTCEVLTTVDADRASVLLASGPVAGRGWRDLVHGEEDRDG